MYDDELSEDERWEKENTITDWPGDLLWWADNQSWPDWVYGRIDGRIRA
jgi:hypothetical protein